MCVCFEIDVNPINETFKSIELMTINHADPKLFQLTYFTIWRNLCMIAHQLHFGKSKILRYKPHKKGLGLQYFSYQGEITEW